MIRRLSAFDVSAGRLARRLLTERHRDEQWLATQLGLPQRQVAALLSGIRSSTVSELERMALALGTTLPRFIDRMTAER